MRESCSCLVEPSAHLIDVADLGMGSRFAEVSILKCPECDRHWLRYYYVVEAFSGSGRWYLGAIAPEHLAMLSAEEAKGILEGLEWYYYGGSYFNGGRQGVGSYHAQSLSRCCRTYS